MSFNAENDGTKGEIEINSLKYISRSREKKFSSSSEEKADARRGKKCARDLAGIPRRSFNL